MPSFEIDTREYQFSHGKAPRGQGSWGFEIKRFGKVVAECWPQGEHSYSEAVKVARKAATEAKATTIKVMP